MTWFICWTTAEWPQVPPLAAWWEGTPGPRKAGIKAMWLASRLCVECSLFPFPMGAINKQKNRLWVLLGNCLGHLLLPKQPLARDHGEESEARLSGHQLYKYPFHSCWSGGVRLTSKREMWAHLVILRRLLRSLSRITHMHVHYILQLSSRAVKAFQMFEDNLSQTAIMHSSGVNKTGCL